MALSQNEFDQDLVGGWRTIAEKPGCRLVAADLVRNYRKLHHSTASILYWHEGQLRALAGHSRAAIRLFEKSRKPEPDAFGWNLYVDGTIAFLKHDRAGLKAARDRLALLARPADFHPTGPDGKPMEIGWPPNLNVLDGLLACSGRTYDAAYGRPECVRPIRQVR